MPSRADTVEKNERQFIRVGFKSTQTDKEI